MAIPAATVLPDDLTTARLLLRPPRLTDAPTIHEAILESFAELNAWMEWAAEVPALADTEAFCEQSIRQRGDGTACPLLMLERDTQRFVGGTGYPRIDWRVPSFEIGYWCRTPLCGRGYVTEAAEALIRYAFSTLAAKRVEIRMDHRNLPSAAVAERLGFELEGVLRNQVRDHHGRLRDTRVYALLSPSRS